jgi:hypothetical protein
MGGAPVPFARGERPVTQLRDTFDGAFQVALAVGVVAVFAVTYWALPSPESRL